MPTSQKRDAPAAFVRAKMLKWRGSMAQLGSFQKVLCKRSIPSSSPSESPMTWDNPPLNFPNFNHFKADSLEQARTPELFLEAVLPLYCLQLPDMSWASLKWKAFNEGLKTLSRKGCIRVSALFRWRDPSHEPNTVSYEWWQVGKLSKKEPTYLTYFSISVFLCIFARDVPYEYGCVSHRDEGMSGGSEQLVATVSRSYPKLWFN